MRWGQRIGRTLMMRRMKFRLEKIQTMDRILTIISTKLMCTMSSLSSFLYFSPPYKTLRSLSFLQLIFSPFDLCRTST